MRAATLIVTTFLFGCATQSETRRGDILTVATVGEYVLIGYSFSLGTTGSFSLESVYGGPLSCEGRFRYPRPPDGAAYFECSDRHPGPIRIKVDGILTGKGSGDSPMGPIHVVYGYSIAVMNEILTLPKGTLLLQDDRGIGFTNLRGDGGIFTRFVKG